MAEYKRYKGSGPMSIEVDKTTAGDKLAEVRIHLNAAATQESLTITLDSANGTAYDVNFLTQSMVGVQDIVFTPSRPLFLIDGNDKFVIAFANTDAKSWGVEVLVDKGV